jgi:aryl-alcohol dehydrogenase-like predicted oxidoreductase
MTTLGTTGIDVYPLALGTNVFGWTADEKSAFEVLDAYAAAGGNFIDTANQYPYWVPGNVGGESETIIGRWMRARGNRADVVLATKVGGEMPGLPTDLKASTIKRAADESLARLQTDYIDVYYAHYDDPSTPLEETLGAFDELVRAGKVRHIAASNHPAARLAAALDVSEREGLSAYAVYQPQYNLLDREFESKLQPLCVERGLAAVPYWVLAQGFLTGKYRSEDAVVDSARAADAREYLGLGGAELLAVMDELAAAHDTTLAPIALAWSRARAGVVAPMASARTPEQLAELLPFVSIELGDDEVAALDAAVTVA